MTVLELDDDFQKYLQENHYTFVGPQNPDSLDLFIKKVERVAPSGILGTIHKSLRNREATRQVLNLFANEPIRVYVITPVKASPYILSHSSIKGYCEKMNIQYP